jgi:transposase
MLVKRAYYRSDRRTRRIDADKLSELLRIGALHSVYIGTPRNSELRQMVAHYHRAIGDRVRAIQRVRALFRQYGVQLATRWGTRRTVSLRKLPNVTARQIVRANLRVIGLATLVRDEARAQVIAIARSSPHFQLLQSIPYIGELRAAELIAIVETPHRFTSVRSFWAYAGLAVVHRVSADRPVDGAEVSKRKAKTRGLRLTRLVSHVSEDSFGKSLLMRPSDEASFAISMTDT